MAIKYTEIFSKIKNSPLNEEELSILKEVEIYIDDEISKTFDGGTVRINLDIVKFVKHRIPPLRKEMLHNKIIEIYYEAGWKCGYEYGEDDGPNRPGFDYWVLAGRV
jgi:hypothetical protein